jgi:hypothetical protein
MLAAAGAGGARGAGAQQALTLVVSKREQPPAARAGQERAAWRGGAGGRTEALTLRHGA